MAVAEFLKGIGKGAGSVAGFVASRPSALFSNVGKGISTVVSGVGRVLGMLVEFPAYIIANHPELIALVLVGAKLAGGVGAFVCGSSTIALVGAAYVAWQIYKKKKDLGAESSVDKITDSFMDKWEDFFEKAKSSRLAWR